MTKIFYPSPTADRSAYIDGLKCTEKEFQAIREDMAVGSRKFLLKRESGSVVCEFDLREMREYVAVLSGRANTVRFADQLRKVQGTTHQPGSANLWLVTTRQKIDQRWGTMKIMQLVAAAMAVSLLSVGPARAQFVVSDPATEAETLATALETAANLEQTITMVAMLTSAYGVTGLLTSLNQKISIPRPGTWTRKCFRRECQCRPRHVRSPPIQIAP